ncbi:MAG: hypothetical protein IJV33_00015 [Bacteroidaceae bacterium]|nr:hypothetical protein [Bacteroidaceae bacterium]
MEKKTYQKPQMEVIELDSMNILVVSGGWGGEATDPAKAPLRDAWDDAFEDNEAAQTFENLLW